MLTDTGLQEIPQSVNSRGMSCILYTRTSNNSLCKTFIIAFLIKLIKCIIKHFNMAYAQDSGVCNYTYVYTFKRLCLL